MVCPSSGDVRQVCASARTGSRLTAAGRTLAAIALLVFLPTPAPAAPDFSKSELLVSSAAPREADLVTFTLVLRNTGADDAGSVSLIVEWPIMGFLVDAGGFGAPQIDHEERRIRDTFPLAAGAERRFDLRVLTPRESGGDALTVAFGAAHYASSTEYWDRRSVVVDTRPARTGIVVGGFRILPAGVAVIAWLIALALLWVVVGVLAGRRRAAPRQSPSGHSSLGSLIASRIGPGGAVAAVMIALGFWMIFSAMAWRDYQSLTRWPETRCTILGGRLNAQTTTRTSTRPREDTTNYVPVLGLRYDVSGHEMFSSGYDTGSRLGIGGRGGRTAELGGWTIGSTVPCWYNPDDPLDVVVRRGFGGAYLFALLPAPVFLLGVAGLRRSVFG